MARLVDGVPPLLVRLLMQEKKHTGMLIYKLFFFLGYSRLPTCIDTSASTPSAPSTVWGIWDFNRFELSIKRWNLGLILGDSDSKSKVGSWVRNHPPPSNTHTLHRICDLMMRGTILIPLPGRLVQTDLNGTRTEV